VKNSEKQKIVGQRARAGARTARTAERPEEMSKNRMFTKLRVKKTLE